MEKPIKIRLHIMSPVHIGCDDVYEPTSFVIDENRKKLIEFDPMDFIKSISPQDTKKFTDICMEGNISSIVKIYNFISGRPVKGREIEISDGLVESYRRVKGLSINNEKKIGQELDKFAISRTAYNPHNNLPYIPGSSVKGALRTAYLSKLAVNKGVKGRKDGANALEKELMEGSFDTDPFRMVKPSDFLPVGDVKTKIVYAVNKKKKSSGEARGPFQILEVLKEDSVFEGFLNIYQPEKISGVKTPIKVEGLLKAAHDFYKKIINDESKVIEEIGMKRTIPYRINDKFGDKKEKTAFLIRIGRHSGAESVTIEGNRWIKISPPDKPHKFSNNGATTLWLASESSKPNSNEKLVPFGWAMMEVMPS